VNVLNHATLRRAPRGRPGLVGCLLRSVRPDGRRTGGQVELCGKNRSDTDWPNRKLSCSGCSKRSTHTRQTFGQWRRHQSDDQSGLSSTAPDHASATQRPPMYVTAAAVGVCWKHPRTEHLRMSLYHQWCRTCDSPTHYWDPFLIDSAPVGPRSRTGMLSTIIEPLKIAPVPLGASQIPTHKPSRRCVAVV